MLTLRITPVLLSLLALPLTNCGSVVQVREGDAGGPAGGAAGGAADEMNVDASPAGGANSQICSFSFSSGPKSAAGGSGDAAGGSGDAAGGSGDSLPATVCNCTRRPGSGNTFQCPPGSGVSVSADVGPAGADVQLSGTPNTLGVPVRLSIPPNALSQTVTVRITEVSAPPPAGFGDFSPLYHFEPEGLKFNGPVQVQMPANSGYVPPASSLSVPQSLSIYWSSEGNSCALERLADNYINAGFNQGSITHFGWGIVGVVPVTPGCP